MPDLTIVDRNLAKPSFTNLSNAGPVSTAAVQLFFADAFSLLLSLMTLSTTLVSSVRWAGVMPGRHTRRASCQSSHRCPAPSDPGFRPGTGYLQ